jgi:polar amino acid transport system permease protein
MDMRDIYDELVRWTPFLAGGFALNIAVAAVAMLLGTAAAAMLALMREARGHLTVGSGLTITSFSRNVPTFVLLFYVAYLVPPEVVVLGFTIAIATWLKAALALSVGVVGSVSDGLAVAIRDWRRGQREAAILLLPELVKCLSIVIIYSSGASIIGVSEIVSRCNTVVAATGKLSLLVWIYIYAMIWFFVLCYPLVRTMDWLKERLRYRSWGPQPR